MNKIKRAIVDSVFPHVKPQTELDGNIVHEVKIEEIMDTLYINFHLLVREAYEEGTYNQDVNWEDTYEIWLEDREKNVETL